MYVYMSVYVLARTRVYRDPDIRRCVHGDVRTELYGVSVCRVRGVFFFVWLPSWFCFKIEKERQKAFLHSGFLSSVSRLSVVVGGLDTLRQWEKLETDRSDKPLSPPRIEEIVIFKNPFEDAKKEIEEEKTKEQDQDRKKKEVSLPPGLGNCMTLARFH